MIPFQDFKEHYRRIKADVDAAIARVLDRGWFVLGEEGERFEEELARSLDVPHVVACGSGTDAIALALRAAGVKPGDPVATVALTAVPTVNAITDAGARPVFVDVERRTGLMDAADLARKMHRSVRAVVPVHLYGRTCDMEAIRGVARAGGDVPVIEDCAQALGARRFGHAAGWWGDLAAFSFYPTKTLGAFGDGGAIAVCDPEQAKLLRMLRNHGQSRRYHHEMRGRNSRLDEMQAAILRAKLPHLAGWNERRREIASIYHERIATRAVELPPDDPANEAVFHLFEVRCAARDRLQAHLKERGVETLIHYPVPCHLQPAYADLGGREGDLPETERWAREVLSLPCYPEMPDASVEAVAAAVNAFPCAS